MLEIVSTASVCHVLGCFWVTIDLSTIRNIELISCQVMLDSLQNHYFECGLCHEDCFDSGLFKILDFPRTWL